MLTAVIRMLLLSMLLALVPGAAAAAIKTDSVTYKDGDTELEGFVAYDDSLDVNRPGILIVHQWKGITDHERTVAKRLAGMGYIAFCADIYGKGVRPTDPKDSGAQAGKYKGDRALFRQRIEAGLNQLRGVRNVDGKQIAVIGYCFGGTAALETARMGADVKGVVSFHGGLSAGDVESKPIRAKILVLHGAADPHVPKEEIDAFHKEMDAAGADWQMVYYSGAVHSFTEKNAKGETARYDENADKRSWEAMKAFFAEIFPK